MTTIDNLTDEQIQTLRDEATKHGDKITVGVCDTALDHPGNYLGHGKRERVEKARDLARAECVRLIAESER